MLHNLIQIENTNLPKISAYQIETVYGLISIIQAPEGILCSSFEPLDEVIKNYTHLNLTQWCSDFNNDMSSIIQEVINYDRDYSLNLIVKGTEFQQLVWKEILKIKKGHTSTYKHIAESLQNPGSVRAVGAAVGANNHAILIPCHRVLYQNGHSGHFRWGADRKRELLRIEKVEAFQFKELF